MGSRVFLWVFSMNITHTEVLESPTPSVHAATIEFWDNHPVFAWFGGTREGAGDVSIYIKNLNGDNNLIEVGGMDNVPRWNPILFAHEDNLWLFEKAGVFCDRWQTFVHNITDWSDADKTKTISQGQVIPAGYNGPVKTRPIVFCGEVMCGSSVETFHDWTSYIETFYVEDNKWKYCYRSNPLNVEEKIVVQDYMGRDKTSLGIIQPAIWLGEDNCPCSFFRSSSGLNKIYFSHMIDDEHWSTPVATNLPNPNSGVDVASYDGRTFLISNPSATMRSPLVVQEIVMKPYTAKTLEGYGSEWEIVDEIVVKDEVAEEHRRNTPGWSCNSLELSYPYMIERDGELHIVYTYGRSKINYCTISLK